MTKGLMLCALLISVATPACTSTLTPATLNAAGRIDTNEEVDPNDIQVAAPFREEWTRFVVVADFNENQTINDFYYQTLVNTGRFGTVYNREGLEQYIIANDIQDVTDASSILSMRNMARTQGPFLMLRPYVEYEGGYDYRASIEAIDAETGQVVFRVDKTAFNWAGLDGVLFYPIFNQMLAWFDGELPVNTDRVTRPVDGEEAAAAQAPAE